MNTKQFLRNQLFTFCLVLYAEQPTKPANRRYIRDGFLQVIQDEWVGYVKAWSMVIRGERGGGVCARTYNSVNVLQNCVKFCSVGGATPKSFNVVVPSR